MGIVLKHLWFLWFLSLVATMGAFLGCDGDREDLEEVLLSDSLRDSASIASDGGASHDSGASIHEAGIDGASSVADGGAPPAEPLDEALFPELAKSIKAAPPWIDDRFDVVLYPDRQQLLSILFESSVGSRAGNLSVEPVICFVKYLKYRRPSRDLISQVLSIGSAPDLSISIRLGRRPRELRRLANNSPSDFFAIPLVSLSKGDPIELWFTDRDFIFNDHLGSAKGDYDGHLPLKISSDVAYSELRVVGAKQLRKTLAEIAKRVRGNIQDLESARPDPEALHRGFPTPSWRELRGGLAMIANLAGWETPEVSPLLKRWSTAEQGFRARIVEQARAASAKNEVNREIELAGTPLSLKLVPAACGSSDPSSSCSVLLHLTNTSEKMIRLLVDRRAFDMDEITLTKAWIVFSDGTVHQSERLDPGDGRHDELRLEANTAFEINFSVGIKSPTADIDRLPFQDALVEPSASPIVFELHYRVQKQNRVIAFPLEISR